MPDLGIQQGHKIHLSYFIATFTCRNRRDSNAVFSVSLSLTSRVMLSSASGAETFKPSADAEKKNNRDKKKE